MSIYNYIIEKRFDKIGKKIKGYFHSIWAVTGLEKILYSFNKASQRLAYKLYYFEKLFGFNAVFKESGYRVIACENTHVRFPYPEPKGLNLKYWYPGKKVERPTNRRLMKIDLSNYEYNFIETNGAVEITVRISLGDIACVHVHDEKLIFIRPESGHLTQMQISPKAIWEHAEINKMIKYIPNII